MVSTYFTRSSFAPSRFTARMKAAARQPPGCLILHETGFASCFRASSSTKFSTMSAAREASIERRTAYSRRWSQSASATSACRRFFPEAIAAKFDWVDLPWHSLTVVCPAIPGYLPNGKFLHLSASHFAFSKPLDSRGPLKDEKGGSETSPPEHSRQTRKEFSHDICSCPAHWLPPKSRPCCGSCAGHHAG